MRGRGERLLSSRRVCIMSLPSLVLLPESYAMTRRRLLALLALLLLPALAHAGSSNSLLDVKPDGSHLLVVNADNGTVTLVDLKERQAVREIEVGEKPEGVTW